MTIAEIRERILDEIKDSSIKFPLLDLCEIITSIQSRVDEFEKKKRSKGFVPPTWDEVSAYCNERKNGIDPQDFIDSNSAKGWVIGTNKTPAKCWKAMIRTWENTAKKNGGGNGLQVTGGSRQFRSAGERKTDLAGEAREASLRNIGLRGNGAGLAPDVHYRPVHAPRLKGSNAVAGTMDNPISNHPTVETKEND
jgi:hypothetical protein